MPNSCNGWKNAFVIQQPHFTETDNSFDCWLEYRYSNASVKWPALRGVSKMSLHLDYPLLPRF
jgi:hypothetical protein